MLDNGNFGKFLVAVMKAELLCLSFFFILCGFFHPFVDFYDSFTVPSH